jgi:hypothetical protein
MTEFVETCGSDQRNRKYVIKKGFMFCGVQGQFVYILVLTFFVVFCCSCSNYCT